MRQVNTYNRLDRWVVLVDTPKKSGAFRRLCIKDGGQAIWGVHIADTVPTGAGEHKQPQSMLMVPQGVVWIGGGIITTPRRMVHSGTCIRLTVAQHRKVLEHLHAYFFGANHKPRVWTARTGKRWLSVAQNGSVVWVMPIADDETMSGPMSTHVEGVGHIAVAGGVRPAKVSVLGKTDTYASEADRRTIGEAVSGFFAAPTKQQQQR